MPWNFTEQPAVSINAAFTKSGLPIGLQIVGRRFDDHGVLKLAKAWETRARADHQLAAAAGRMIPKSVKPLSYRIMRKRSQPIRPSTGKASSSQ